MYQKIYILLFCLWFLVVACFAQPDSLPVNITLDKNESGDSLWLTISTNNYTYPSSIMLTASLEDPSKRDTFFLPVIDSVLQYCFVYPHAIQKDLLLQVYFYPGIFKVAGILHGGENHPAIKAILFTANKYLYSQEIIFKDDNHFTLPPLVFEKEASLAFNFANNKSWQRHPDVSISVSPAAKDFKELIFRAEIKGAGIEPSGDHNVKDSVKKNIKDPKFKSLEEVKINAAKKSNIVKFNEEYSTGIFRGGFERIIDCIDNSNILAYGNCISYLQTQVPGLRVSTELYGQVVLRMRQQQVMAFYIDEIPVDIEQLMGVNTGEIAMLKVYQAPFFGSSNGGGGAIALYTRRGKYHRSTGSNWLFVIKGYAPQVNILFEEK